VNFDLYFELDEKLIYNQTIDGSVSFGIPGLSIDVFGLLDAGVFVDIILDTSDNQVAVELGVDACIGAVGFQVCRPDPPLDVFNFDVPINDFCDSGYANVVE